VEVAPQVVPKKKKGELYEDREGVMTLWQGGGGKIQGPAVVVRRRKKRKFSPLRGEKTRPRSSRVGKGKKGHVRLKGRGQ